MSIDDPTASYVAPSTWTGAHVMHRMQEAFRTLADLPSRVLPTGHGSAWPAYVYEFADAVAQWSPQPGESGEAAEMRVSAEKSEKLARLRRIPSPEEVAMMNEAFWWPVNYFGGEKADRVLIVKWARKRARNERYQDRMIVAVEAEARRIAAGLKRDRVIVR